MVLSIMIVILILFEIFMATAEGVSDSAQKISIGVGVIIVIWMLFKIL